MTITNVLEEDWKTHYCQYRTYVELSEAFGVNFRLPNVASKMVSIIRKTSAVAWLCGRGLPVSSVRVTGEQFT